MNEWFWVGLSVALFFATYLTIRVRREKDRDHRFKKTTKALKRQAKRFKP